MSYYTGNVAVGIAQRAPSPVVSKQFDVLAADDSTASTSFTDTDLTLTLANRTGGKALISVCAYGNQSTTTIRENYVSIHHNGAVVPGARADFRQSGTYPLNAHLVDDLDGGVVKVQFKVNAAVLTLKGVNGRCHLGIYEVGGLT